MALSSQPKARQLAVAALATVLAVAGAYVAYTNRAHFKKKKNENVAATATFDCDAYDLTVLILGRESAYFHPFYRRCHGSFFNSNTTSLLMQSYRVFPVRENQLWVQP